MQSSASTDDSYRPRILVIDDEPTFTRLLKLNLEETGRYLVGVENDPRLALAVTLSFRPDLILLDVMMPMLDGGDVANLLRQHPLAKRIPVVFMTATVSHVEVDGRHGSFGGLEFISKPVVMAELMAFLGSRLSGLQSSTWMRYA